MTIPVYSGTIPNLGQTQPEFDQNTQDAIDYQLTLAPALNDFASNLNNFSTTTSSTTSNSIATGNKTFTVEAGKSFIVGMSLRAAYDTTNYMNGEVFSYSGTTLVIKVNSVKGTGTYADWDIFASQDSIIGNDQLDPQFIDDMSIVTFDPALDYVAIADGSDSGNKKKALLPNTAMQSIDYTLSGNALTLKLNPTTLAFRSTTLTNGQPTFVSNSAQITTTISSGSTGGTISGVSSDIVLLAINNAGTMELAWVNLAGGVNLDETTLINTTAEGGAGAADSENIIYSTTARTGVAFRVVGLFRSTQTTAGTWAQTPTLVQPLGGQALAAMQSLGYGQTLQSVTRTSGVTYYNTTGRPILVYYTAQCAVSASISGYLNGFLVGIVQGSGGTLTLHTFFLTVPVNSSYSFTSNNVASSVYEMR